MTLHRMKFSFPYKNNRRKGKNCIAFLINPGNQIFQLLCIFLFSLNAEMLLSDLWHPYK